MIRRLPILPTTWLLVAAAHAGGHFDVDDAGMLDPGQCQYEVWGGRFGTQPYDSLHLGPACRTGPVELGLNIERDTIPGQRSDFLGPRLKWAFLGQGDDDRLGAALAFSVGFDATHGGRPAGQFAVPVSWHALDSLWINANLGADWAPQSGERTARGGLQANWALDDRASLIAERFRAFGVWSTRAGMRFNVTPMISIDVSGVRSGPDRVWGYAVGLSQQFHGP
jgi:hypothetical protein